jgi:hypothetical protein
MYGMYLDDVREQVRRLPTRCVSSTKTNYCCFGLEKPGCYKRVGHPILRSFLEKAWSFSIKKLKIGRSPDIEIIFRKSMEFFYKKTENRQVT